MALVTSADLSRLANWITKAGEDLKLNNGLHTRPNTTLDPCIAKSAENEQIYAQRPATLLSGNLATHSVDKDHLQDLDRHGESHTW